MTAKIDAKAYEPLYAINWALDHIEDDYDRLEFLSAWRQGDFEEWPDYVEWAKAQQ